MDPWLHVENKLAKYKAEFKAQTIQLEERLGVHLGVLEKDLSIVKKSNRELEKDLSTVKKSNRELEKDLSTVKKSNREFEIDLSSLKASNKDIKERVNHVGYV